MTSERSTVYQSEANYNKQCSTSDNVFFDNEVKKDSEIQLNDIQIQPLVPSGELVIVNRDSTQSSVMPPDQSNMVVTPSGESRYHSEAATGVSKMSDEHKLSQSDRSHICMTCFKGFRNKPQLTQHELVHNNVRKHVCQYCEKSFKQVCHLNQHLRVHTGERPYKCDVEGCGRSFAQLSNLNHHKKNHEDHVRRDISRQYRCDVCDRSYATKNSLITHVQKLHSVIISKESSGSLPSYTSTVRKKRKKNSTDDGTSNINMSIVKTEPGFTGDHDLPTQVKVKSENEQNSGLPVHSGTSTLSEDKDSLKTMTTRTNLPLPFTIPFDHYHQGQGLTSYTTSFTNPAVFSQHLGQGHMLPNPPPLLSSNIDHVQKATNNLSQNPSHSFPAFNIKSEHIEGRDDDRCLSSTVTTHDAMQAEQRALMQVAVSQLDIGDKKSHINQTYSQSLNSVSNVHLLHQEHMLPSNHSSGNHGNRQEQMLHRVMGNDAPSHVAHHYPVTSSMPQSCPSIGMYSQSLKDKNTSRHDRFNQGQF